MDSTATLSPSSELSFSAKRAERGLPPDHNIPGNKAIWVGILSEMTEFAVMFIAYFIVRAHNPEAFDAGPQQLSTLAGTINTLVLLTSSFFVARAMIAIRRDQITACLRWLWAAVACGATYLIVKYFEYEWNAAQGITLDGDAFHAVYYYTTFNHLLHVGWGSAAILWGIFCVKKGIYTAEKSKGLEAVAVYWHMIDLAWIVIFPLLYVMR